jgi:Ca2+-binding EF-hand superfamily protein
MAGWTPYGDCREQFVPAGGGNLAEQDIADMMILLDTDGDGSIDYQEFARWFGAGPPPPPMLPEVKSRLDAQAEAGGTPQEHLDAIQAAAEKRSRRMLMNLKREMGAFFKASGVALEQQFRGFDANGDGEIDHHEFRDGLMSLGANISEAQIADLITILDKDGDGTIDYQEFARWFGAGPPPPPMTPDMKQRAEMQASSSNPQEHLDAIQAAAEKRSRKLLMVLKTELSNVFKASGVSLERQFRGFDTDGDGAIDHDEFRNGLMSLGATISETQIYDLITILDKDGDGTIDYQEFARWFGAGPPPPPMLPQAKQMMDSRAASSVDPSALLREIQVKAMEMGKAIGIEASQDDPSALLREIEAMAKRRMAARAQPSQGAFSGGGRDVFLAEIAQKAKQMGGLMGALGEIEAVRSLSIACWCCQPAKVICVCSYCVQNVSQLVAAGWWWQRQRSVPSGAAGQGTRIHLWGLYLTNEQAHSHTRGQPGTIPLRYEFVSSGALTDGAGGFD